MIVLFSCRKEPHEFLEKATQKLKQENAMDALLLYQRAFEYSLDKDSFLTDIYDYYDSFQITSTGRWVIALKKNIDMDEILLSDKKYTKALNKPAESKLTIFDLEEDRNFHYKVSKNFYSSYLSPSGKYLLIKTKQKDLCSLKGIHIDSEKQYAIPDLNVSCESVDAISDNGEVYYFKYPHIGKYSLVTSKNEYPFVSKKFSYVISKVPGKSVFNISSLQKVFFLYGLAGKYSLYELKANKKKLFFMTSSVAYPKIIFMKNKDYPGVLIGGADKYRFLFYQTDKERKSAHIFSANFWDLVSFFNDKKFATIEDSLLFCYDLNKKGKKKTDDKSKTKEDKNIYEYDADGKKNLPFWATTIQMDYKGNLYILTPTGSLIRWNEQIPIKKESFDIYNGGIELDPNH